jgi:hypothetical protein
MTDDIKKQLIIAAKHVQAMYKLRRSPLEGKDATTASRAFTWSEEILKELENKKND